MIAASAIHPGKMLWRGYCRCW